MSTIRLSIPKFPALVHDYAVQNFNLKALAAGLIAICFLQMVGVLFLLKQGPEIIAIDSDGEVAAVETHVTDVHVRAAIKHYLEYRYSWAFADIQSRLKKAEAFVSPNLVSSFQKSMLETQKYVLEKKITQRLYPRSINIDLKSKTVAIKGDRFTEFEGLKAATEFAAIYEFQLDSRTSMNPWGVYVTKETETAVAK